MDAFAVEGETDELETAWDLIEGLADGTIGIGDVIDGL